MPVFRRWSTPCLGLALLAYLMMSGIDDVHTHEQIIKPSISHYTSMIVVMTDQSTCPICAWHAMTTASCRMVIALLTFPAVMPLATAIPFHVSLTPASTIRSRAPPSIQASRISFACISVAY